MKRFSKHFSKVGSLEFGIIIGLVFSLLYFFTFLDRASLFALQTRIWENYVNKQSQTSLNIYHPSVIAAVYGVSGKIERIEGDNIELTSKGEKLPIFQIRPETEIFQAQRDNTLQPADKSYLETGMNVVVNALYDIQTEKVRVLRVTVNSSSLKPKPSPAL